MAIFSEQDTDHLRIVRAIFHRVGPKDEDLELFDEVPLAKHGEFLKRHILGALGGTRYRFDDDSPTLASLRLIAKSTNNFVRQSKRLAERFHNDHKGLANTLPGVFLVVELGLTAEAYGFALMKIDPSDVIHYKVRRSSKEHVADVSAIANALSSEKAALQKIALVRFTVGSEPLLSVRDRTERGLVPRYFESFLGASPSRSDDESTRLVLSAISKGIDKFRAKLPEHIRANAYLRAAEAVLNLVDFDEQNIAPILAQALAIAVDHEAIVEVKRRLRDAHLDGAAFEPSLPPDAPPLEREIVTVEGVRVHYNESLESSIVSRKSLPDGTQEITIKTSKLTIDDVLPRKRIKN